MTFVAQRDDPHAGLAELETLYETFHRQAIGLAYHMLGDMADAEDAVQDAFICAWRALDRYDPERGSQRTWLLAIVRNRALDTLRARRAHPIEHLDRATSLSDTTDVAMLVQTRLDGANAYTAVASLPPDQQHTIELAFAGGLSHAEIASRTALPLGTIKGRIRLGLHRLRILLDTPPAVAGARAG
jgi:RNA polymerase sigma-70 factor (ECF subfamily)